MSWFDFKGRNHTTGAQRRDCCCGYELYNEVKVEGKENAIAIGVMKMASEEIRKVNKGVGVELAHYLGDGLWTSL